MKSRTPFITAILIIFAAIYLLFDFHLPESTKFWRELQNLGHVPLFGMLSIALIILLEKIAERISRSRIFLYLAAFITTVFLGAATELIQYFTPRDADVSDWIFDIIGAALFLGFYLTFDPKAGHIWKRTGIFPKWLLRMACLAHQPEWQQ